MSDPVYDGLLQLERNFERKFKNLTKAITERVITTASNAKETVSELPIELILLYFMAGLLLVLAVYLLYRCLADRRFEVSYIINCSAAIIRILF
jgi:hypothetical protein